MVTPPAWMRRDGFLPSISSLIASICQWFILTSFGKIRIHSLWFRLNWACVPREGSCKWSKQMPASSIGKGVGAHLSRIRSWSSANACIISIAYCLNSMLEEDSSTATALTQSHHYQLGLWKDCFRPDSASGKVHPLNHPASLPLALLLPPLNRHAIRAIARLGTGVCLHRDANANGMTSESFVENSRWRALIFSVPLYREREATPSFSPSVPMRETLFTPFIILNLQPPNYITSVL